MNCYCNKCCINDDAAKYTYNIRYNFLLHKLECLICAKITNYFGSSLLIYIINTRNIKELLAQTTHHITWFLTQHINSILLTDMRYHMKKLMTYCIDDAAI